MRATAPGKSLKALMPFLLVLTVLGAIPAWAGQPSLPADVPNIFDPQVRAQFTPAGVANLRGNPDFPVLMLENKTGEYPLTMLIGLDARNGKDTWSLASDPIILIVVFADPGTILDVHVDIGFAERGRPSGSYVSLDDPNFLTLGNLIKEVAGVQTRTYM
jgi:hypothetical protein